MTQLPYQSVVSDGNIIYENNIANGTIVAKGETEINEDNSSDDSTINGETFANQTNNEIINNDNDKNADIDDIDDIEDDYVQEGHKQTESAQVRIFCCMNMM